MGFSKLLFFSFFPFFFLQHWPINAETCPEVSCDIVRVDFPFRLSDQPSCCGNPNFNLSCTNQSQTKISFPLSGEFDVFVIGYGWPSLSISDPKNCIAKRLLGGLDLSGTPFEPRYPENYTFFNCSSNSNVSVSHPAIYFSCLSDKKFEVWAIPTTAYDPSSSLRLCLEISTISVPLPSAEYWPHFLDQILLTWEEPDCRLSCNYCVSDHSKKKRGLSTGAKYALIFGLGTPIIFTVVFIIDHNIKVHRYDHQREQSTTAETQLTATTTVNGLEESRIKAYPITLLDESCRLPRPNDNTCSICLSEYKANETIRTVPDCSHYFHADCIGEWLKRNAVCPVCRSMPVLEPALITHPIPTTISSSSAAPPPL